MRSTLLRIATARLRSAKPNQMTVSYGRFVFTLLLLLTTASAWAQDAISGLTYNSAGGYYEINDAQDLIDLATYVNAGNPTMGKTFKQTANITFTHTSDWNNSSSNESNFSGIGDSSHPFKGSYYGQGFTISGVRIYINEDHVGIFRHVYSAIIDGIVLSDSRITGYVITGGIVGRAYKDVGDCIVSNCRVRSNVLIHHTRDDSEYFGGIVGDNRTGCRVVNCVSAVTMTGGSRSKRFGGIVGNNAGTVTNNLAMGVTIGNISEGSGAIAGVNIRGSMSNNYYYDCTVQGSTSDIGAHGSDENGAANASPDHFTASGSEYTIKTDAGWNVFCECLNDNDRYNRFSGKTVKLDNDIEVSRMAGSDNHDFCGTFDGQQHTITLDGNTTNGCYALFRNVSTAKADPNDTEDTPAAIRNLHVTGTISTASQNAAGFISSKWGDVTIENCRSSVAILSSVAGDGTHGGFVAVSNNGKLYIKGCVFDGKLLTTNGTNACGGFVGWHKNSASVIVNDCLYAPAPLDNGETWVGNEESSTFCRNYLTGISKCYYTRPLGSAQGRQVRTITGGDGVTISSITPASSATATYNFSDITAYYSGGLKRGSTYYYGEGDQMALTLSHADRTGYTFNNYTASAGTLAGTTLQMPNADVTINATWTPTTYTISYNLAGGSVASANPTSYTVDTNTFTLYNPTRTGYIFSGWTGSNGSTPQTTVSIAKGSTGNKTYTANWVADPNDFSQNGNEYTIKTAVGWGVFCDLLANNSKGYFSGKTVKLGNSIEVSRMAGGSNHDFTGTFDGNKKTLTFNYGKANDISGESYISPFRNVESNCVIENLHVAGDIYTSGQYAAGFISSQYGTVIIRNCRSSINIHSSRSGDGTHGGFVAINYESANLTIEGCVFDGKLLTIGTTATSHCGGFVGWRAATLTILNCLYAPATIGSGETEVEAGTSSPSATFARNAADGSIVNSFYTRPLGTAQGKQPRSITAGDGVTISAISPIGNATEYNFSGITAYGSGIQRNNTFFYGNGDQVALTLRHADRTGYIFNGYTPSAGTLNGNTLTLPDADVIIDATWTPIRPANLSVSKIATHEATISWTSDAAAWQICLNDDEEHLIDVTEKTYRFTNLAAETTYSVKVRNNYSGTYGEWSDPLSFTTDEACPDGMIEIGWGTSTNQDIPTNTFFAYSLSEQIYTADELGDNAVILTSVQFYGDQNSTRNLDIYIVHTDKTKFSSDTDWITVTDADKVFSGNVTFAADSWTTIEFDDAFYYDGQHNVCLVVDDNSGSWIQEATSFRVFPANGQQTLYYFDDYPDLDPTDAISQEGMGIISQKNCVRFGVVSYGDIALADKADNSSLITAFNDKNVFVTLSGRTLYKDGYWNTLCLPFSLSAKQIEASVLDGADIRTLASTAFDAGTLTLDFEKATTIAAGKPYIVRWTTAAASNVAMVATGGTAGYNSEGYAKLVDGDINTKWCSGGGPWLCEFQTASPITIKGYTLTTGGDTEDFPGRNPTKWALKAKANEGDSWSVIDERNVNTNSSDALPAANTTESQVFAIASKKQGTYQYFRFEVDFVDDGSIMQLAELMLYGNLVDPVFKEVVISDDLQPIETEYVDFIGITSPVDFAANDHSILFLGDENKLYYPDENMTLNSCRGYFKLKGLHAVEVSSARMNFSDGEETLSVNLNGGMITDHGQSETDDLDNWYTLDGRKITGKPTTKGMYIHNGKVVVVK